MAHSCLNCNAAYDPGDRFCRQCGQETADHSKNMRVFLGAFLADYFTFDNKLFRSIVPLLIRPGFLTTEYLSGKRVSYIPPLRMYLFISLVFFLVLGLSGSGEGDEWDRFFDTHLPRLFFLLLPLFAVFLRLLYLNTHRNWVTHFLFSVHFHAFLFLSSLLLAALSALIGMFEGYVVNQVLAAAFGVGWLSYLMLAMHRVYLDKGWRLVLRFLALLTLYAVVLIVSSAVVLLFLTAGAAEAGASLH